MKAGVIYLSVVLQAFESGAWTFRAFIGGVRSGKIVQDYVRHPSPKECVALMQKNLDNQGARELLAEQNKS